MAKKKRPKKTRSEAPGWVWMLFGLSLGLVVAAAVYVSDRGGAPISLPTAPAPPPVAESRVEPPQEAEPVPPHPATRFDFYEMLPKFEVVIPEAEIQARLDQSAASVTEPGSYVLQAGSFTQLTDAESMKANLGLLGLQSRIQRVTIDDDIYHRVRIGPTSDLDELNGIKRRLWDANIDVLLIELPK